MAKQQAEEQIEEIILSDQAKDKVQDFFEKNKTIIAGGFVAILALVIGAWGYTAFIAKPKELKAQVQMIRAQQYFEKDSFNLALNGDGNYFGFETIIDKFGGTPAGKVARLYAGISALQLGEFDLAIKHLNAFKSDDALLNARKFGCLGDAHAEKTDMESAIKNYKSAIAAAPENDIITPEYMLKLAKAQEITGKNDEAVSTYQHIIDQFNDTREKVVAEREQARLQAMTN